MRFLRFPQAPLEASRFVLSRCWGLRGLQLTGKRAHADLLNASNDNGDDCQALCKHSCAEPSLVPYCVPLIHPFECHPQGTARRKHTYGKNNQINCLTR